MAKREEDKPDTDIKQEEERPDMIEVAQSVNMITKEDLKEMKIPKKLIEGSIIALFDRTKPPEKMTDVFCPHFMELKYANGCHYDCQWCYLLGTFGRWERVGDPAPGPKIKDTRHIAKDLKEALKRITTPMLFNSGEVSDGLVGETAMLNTIIPLFREDRTNPHSHKLLILTKSASLRVPMAANATNQIIFSHSINANYVARTWELTAPDPIERLMASRKIVEYGYETRLRLDPMVPVTSWKKGYREMIELIMEKNPWAEVITLGTLRGLTSTITNAKKFNKDVSWKDYLTDTTSWGKRIPLKTRIEMYSYAIEQFERLGYPGEIAICKESLDVWEALWEQGYLPGGTRCNCIL